MLHVSDAVGKYLLLLQNILISTSTRNPLSVVETKLKRKSPKQTINLCWHWNIYLEGSLIKSWPIKCFHCLLCVRRQQPATGQNQAFPYSFNLKKQWNKEGAFWRCKKKYRIRTRTSHSLLHTDANLTVTISTYLNYQVTYLFLQCIPT